MRVCIKNPFLLPLLFASFGLMLAGRVTAQTFTTLHSFSASVPSYTNSSGNIIYTNSDGASPDGQLVLSGNTLYGAAMAGGRSAVGTLFKVNTDGSGFTTLYTFPSTSSSSGFTNQDGGIPVELALFGSILYGTCAGGGLWGNGTVFKINTDGTGFATLHSFAAGSTTTSGAFTNSDGAYPHAGLVLSGNRLYGTTSGGGSDYGTVFTLQVDGTGFTNLHIFHLIPDGAYPEADLTLVGDTLYGTSRLGAPNVDSVALIKGTVFTVKTNGADFTVLHYFLRGSDGDEVSGCLLSGNILYGTASGEGRFYRGTVFALSTDGGYFSVLHGFFEGSPDGVSPRGKPVLLDNTLYGTTSYGGSYGGGVLFAVNTDGSSSRRIHVFTGSSDGAVPSSLILSGTTLYGVANGGGDYGSGTVFAISLPPHLSITPVGAKLVVSWPTNFSGYTLQSTTNLAAAVWTTNSPASVLINAQNTVTNPISGRQQFFRLSQ